MKKILIITYCYPPCNAISSHRPKSFADHFADHGLFPVVVSRHWNGDEKTWLDYQKPNLSPPKITTTDRSTVIQLPYSARRLKRFERVKRFPLLRKAAAFLLLVMGRFQIHNDAVESYEGYLNDYLEKNEIDYIFATCDPLSIAQLGYRLNKRFGIPLIVDFRDLWNNSILSSDYRPSLSERIVDFLYEWYVSKWIAPAKFVTAVTEPINEEVRRISPGIRTVVVMNGFEAELFESFANQPKSQNKKFTFSVIGTFHPEHDISLFVEGMELFLTGVDHSKIQLNLIGTGGIAEVKELFERRFPAECTKLTERIPREEAVAIMTGSDVLFHAGWKNYRGIASGKIFEYMGARRNVLIAPGDNDIMEELVTSTGIGKVANTPQEFAEKLKEWFAEWEQNGRLEWHGDMEKIMTYSRENQARILAKAILELG